MTRDECIEWIENAEHYGLVDSEYDGSGNLWQTHIYEKNDKYYRVGFLNGKPTRSCIKPKDYAPVEVRPVEKRITVTEWEEVEKESSHE